MIISEARSLAPTALDYGTPDIDSILPVPSPLYPLDGDTIEDARVKLRCSAVGSMPHWYLFEVYSDPQLDSIFAADTGGSIYYSVVTSDFITDLTPGGDFWWRVRSESQTDSSAWSEAERFVVPTGKTILVPDNYASIQEAIDSAANLDTVFVKSGVYAEPFNYRGKSVKVMGENPHTTILEAPENGDALAIMATVESAYAELSGFSITGEFDEFAVGANYGARGVIKYNVFRNTSGGSIVDVNSGVRITHNLFYDNDAADCISIKSLAAVTIVNNTFDRNRGAIYCVNSDDRGIIENNIFTNCTGYAIWLAGRFTHDYNDFWGNAADYMNFSGPGPNALFSDPLYSDQQAGDYTLREESPCIDAGDPSPEFFDPDGTRNDMGAYYFGYSDDNVTSVTDTTAASEIIRFSLEQNFPNPFNAATRINFSLPKGEHVSLVIFNLLGQKVATIVDEFKSAGEHSATWNGHDDEGNAAASGLYVYRLTAGEFVESKRMIVLK